MALHEFDLDPVYVTPENSGNGTLSRNYNSSVGVINTSDPLSAIQQAAEKNNAWSAEQAAKQNAFQVAQNDKAMRFSAEQAAINRSWQEEMSNTAHQREVVDLQKAGLNPVLSATGGNGATVGSGASAAGVTSAGAKGDTDESLTMAMMTYMAKMLDAQTSILNTQTSAQATMANSELMANASIYGADLAYALGMNDPKHALTGAIISFLDGMSGGQSDTTSAKSTARKITELGKTVYDNTAGSYDTPKAFKEAVVNPWLEGLFTGKDRTGSSYSPNANGPQNKSTKEASEKAVADARAVLANAAQSSGLNLWKAIDKATNGSLRKKAESTKK